LAKKKTIWRENHATSLQNHKKEAQGQNQMVLIVGVLDLDGLGVKGEIR
jgi:hypothetical protein